MTDHTAHAEGCNGHHCCECGSCLPLFTHVCADCWTAGEEASAVIRAEFERHHPRGERRSRQLPQLRRAA